MKSLLLTLLFALMLAPSMVLAAENTIDKNDLSGFDSLTDLQKAEIAMDIARKAETNVTSVVSFTDKVKVAPEQVDKWVDTGEKIGRMLGGTAKELGIAANEFATSPVGMITMGLVVWNYAGDQLYEFIVGSIWFLIMLPLWTLLFFKVAFRTLSYEDVKKVKSDGSTYTVSKPIKGFVRNKSGDAFAAGVFTFAAAIIIVIGVIIIA